jgi:protein-disulfide isomerase
VINRRQFVSIAAVSAAVGATGIHGSAAQLADTGLPLQNASFILDSGAATPVASPDASPAVNAEPDELTGYILGDPQAANTLQLYADYRCPHCRVFAAEIEPQIIEDFVKPGKLNIEYLDFTVIGVPSFDDLVDDSIESVQAAEAAACAAEQDAYLVYRDWLFQGPSRTSEGDFSDTNLINAAKALGLNVEQFTASLRDGVYEQGIIDSVRAAIERGVQGTPTMILNDNEPFYVPENGYEGLKELLESGLQP